MKRLVLILTVLVLASCPRIESQQVRPRRASGAYRIGQRAPDMPVATGM